MLNYKKVMMGLALFVVCVSSSSEAMMSFYNGSNTSYPPRLVRQSNQYQTFNLYPRLVASAFSQSGVINKKLGATLSAPNPQTQQLPFSIQGAIPPSSFDVNSLTDGYTNNPIAYCGYVPIIDQYNVWNNYIANGGYPVFQPTQTPQSNTIVQPQLFPAANGISFWGGNVFLPGNDPFRVSFR